LGKRREVGRISWSAPAGGGSAFSQAVRKRCWGKLGQKRTVWQPHDLKLFRSWPISYAKQDPNPDVDVKIPI
jgi:hypothetical protein